MRVALQDKLEQLPGRPGVYLFKDAAGKVVYVGKARVLRDRVRSYFQASRPADPLRDALAADIADLDLVVTDTEMEALALENNLIKRHQPRYNVLLRDDKNHPYLKLTLAEEYPRLYVVRRPGEDGNAYGGPYIPASLGRKTAALAHRLFGIRSCKETLNGRRARPCLQYQIQRCLAPCVAEICSPERYRQASEDARLFLEGRTDEVVGRLRGEMADAAGKSASRRRGSLRDQVRTLERLDAPQKITTNDLEERDLFGAHVEGERAALQVFSVRDGRSWRARASCSTAWPSPRASWPQSIQQYYAQGRYVPREIAGAAASPRTSELLEAWLSAARRGTRCASACRSAGEKVRLLELVLRNARLAFDLEWRSRASSRRRSCARCATCWTWKSSRAASSASTSRTSRARTSWPRWWCFEDGLPKKSDYRKFRDARRVGRARRLRVHARGGGPALPAPARGGQGAARPGPGRRRQGPARRGHRARWRSWAWATSRWRAWPSRRS